MDYALFGLEPWGHHLTNLVFHNLNSLLVFLLGVILMPHTFQGMLAAGLAALFFGIHPQHVESVAWIAERKDVLCQFFTLLSLICYVLFTRRSNRSWYFSALFCFILALLSKPMAVTLPVILLLIDIYPLKRTVWVMNQAVALRQLLLEKLPFLLLSTLVIFITLFAQKTALASIEEVGITTRLFNAFNSIILYLSKFIFPLNLVPFYPQVTHYTGLAFIPVIAFCLISFVCGYLWYKKQFYWLIAWLFYLITLSPVLGIIQVGLQSAADRYTYLPTLPFYFLMGMGISNVLFTSCRIYKVGTTLLTIFISVAFIHLTRQQTLIWKDDVTLWYYTALQFPESSFVQTNLGTAYLNANRPLKALEHYQLGAALAPNEKEIQISIAETYLTLHLPQEALKTYQTLIDSHFELEFVYYRMATILVQQHQMEQARVYLTKVLEMNPHHKAAQTLLARINERIINK